MLKTILSVAGKPGLYKLVSNGKNMIIVESLVDKKKMPIHARDKVVSLGDISIYTDEDEVPLREVFVSMQTKENGAKASIAPNAKPEELKKYLGEVLPKFDRERVYPTDIKKMIMWYNILTDAEIDFLDEKAINETSEEAETKEGETPKEGKAATKKPAAKKETAKKTTTPKKTASPKASTKSKAPKAAAPRKAQ